MSDEAYLNETRDAPLTATVVSSAGASVEAQAPVVNVTPVATSAPLASAPLASAPPAAAAARLPERSQTRSAGGQIVSAAHRAVAEVSYRVSRVGVAGVAGIALLAAGIATLVLVSLPQRAAIEALRASIAHPAAPVSASGFAAAQVGRMLTTLPPRSQAPEVMEKILAAATAAGVELPHGQYEFIPARDGMAAYYRVSLPVHATYLQLRDFMDRTMVALPGVGVEGMRIERKTVGDELVQAEVKFAVYVRDPG